MIEGKNILCFGSENWEYPGFQQVLMRKLSSANKVLFVNPLGSRKIKFRYSQFGFYLRKIKRTFEKNHAPSSNTLVCSPVIIPLVYNRLVTRMNKHLVKYQFRKLLDQQQFKPEILWVGTPTSAFLLDVFDPDLIVYHAVDRFSKFSFVDEGKMRAYEKRVAEKADLILCTSDTIRNDLVGYNRNAYTVTHAVDFDHFNAARSSDDVPEDIRDIPAPIIGYFGGLAERINYSLIREVALRYPEASVVLIGQKHFDLTEIEGLPNVHLLGHRSYERLPFYLKKFSVCLIPYVVNELMLGVDPIKLREYLCQGKAVVSVDLPEVRKLKELVYIAEDDEDFIRKVGEAMKENGAMYEGPRIKAAKGCVWERKLEEISDIVNMALKRKRGARAPSASTSIEGKKVIQAF